MKDNVNMNCDSVTVDLIKLLGIQNLPYLTFLIRPIVELTPKKSTELSSTLDQRINHEDSSTASKNVSSSSTATTTTNSIALNYFAETLLHSSSIGLLSVWSIGQRCSKNDVLYHLEHSLELTNLFLKGLKQIHTISILNDDDQRTKMTYRRMCSGDAPDDSLPKTVIIFRFEDNNMAEVSNIVSILSY
jgi:hypothetical protein